MRNRAMTAPTTIIRRFRRGRCWRCRCGTRFPVQSLLRAGRQLALSACSPATSTPSTRSGKGRRLGRVHAVHTVRTGMGLDAESLRILAS